MHQELISLKRKTNKTRTTTKESELQTTNYTLPIHEPADRSRFFPFRYNNYTQSAFRRVTPLILDCAYEIIGSWEENIV